jgi:hypothetical protein
VEKLIHWNLILGCMYCWKNKNLFAVENVKEPLRGAGSRESDFLIMWRGNLIGTSNKIELFFCWCTFDFDPEINLEDFFWFHRRWKCIYHFGLDLKFGVIQYSNHLLKVGDLLKLVHSNWAKKVLLFWGIGMYGNCS